MRIYPNKKQSEKFEKPMLTGLEKVMRQLALIVVFVGVFFFFFKILFF